MWSLPSRNLPRDPHGLFKEDIGWDPFDEVHQSPLEVAQGGRFLGRKSSIWRNPGAGNTAKLLSICPSVWDPLVSLSHLHSWGFSHLIFLSPPAPLCIHTASHVQNGQGLLIWQLNLLQRNEETAQRLRNTQSHSTSQLLREEGVTLGTSCPILCPQRRSRLAHFAGALKLSPNLILLWEKDSLSWGHFPKICLNL